jgi:hypothetical protein
MPAEMATCILDDMLAFIGTRITSILLGPGDKDRNYITSLHNEVVSKFQQPETSGIAVD